MSHGTNCDCMMCKAGKKMGVIHKEEKPQQEQRSDTTYTCSSCGSHSSGTPGTCCGKERKA